MKIQTVYVQGEHNRPSGGTKVIHQLVNLFREKGYQSFVFSPKEEVYQPAWLEKSAPVIGLEQVSSMCQENDIIVGGWPSRGISEAISKLPAEIKIFYPQCNFFLKGKDMIGDEVFKKKWGYTHFWAVSKSNKDTLDKKYGVNCHIVHPYFDQDLYKDSVHDMKKRSQRTLVLHRKGAPFVLFIKKVFSNQATFFSFKGKFTERDFIREASDSKFFLHTALGYQPNKKKQIRKIAKYLLTLSRVNRITKTTYAGSKYDEGFPLPPAEACMSGCIIIGFAKNGDLEWMDANNSFIAKDRSYIDLYRQFKKAINTEDALLQDMHMNAFQKLEKFDKENTWKEITTFLNNAQ